jgi:hypothetical protein
MKLPGCEIEWILKELLLGVYGFDRCLSIQLSAEHAIIIPYAMPFGSSDMPQLAWSNESHAV